MSIKTRISRNFINIPGWNTHKKIVVIESDDWGSIRMPSKEVYQQFLNNGIRVDKDQFCRYDCLATAEDLEALFDVLTSVKDKNGKHAILTADAVVANPDFEKIKSSNFTEYYYEPFLETLNKSPKHNGAFNLWQQGIEAQIFYPQFHGREHLNVKKWMAALQENNPIIKTAFDLGTFGLTPDVDKQIKSGFMGAFDSGEDEDIEYYKGVLTEGLDLFENIFNYRSESFIATRYTWNPKIEPTLVQHGVKYLQGMVAQKIPLEGENYKYKRNNYLGTKANSGLIYLMRNCYFEPTQTPGFNWVDDCLNRVKIAFRWHKPATISMHRLNIIGAIDETNRTNNLKLLKRLLSEIVKRYPDVEFMSSDELGNLLNNQ